MTYRYRPRPESPYIDVFPKYPYNTPIFGSELLSASLGDPQMFFAGSPLDSAHRRSSLQSSNLPTNKLRQQISPINSGQGSFQCDSSTQIFQSHNVIAPEIYGSFSNGDSGQLQRNYDPHNAASQTKSIYNNTDTFGSSVISTTGLLQSQVFKPNFAQQPIQGFISSSAATSQAYLNGSMTQSQTPYGPHITTSSNNGVTAGSMSNYTATMSSNAQEEISTIFVVGFPDDMQVPSFLVCMLLCNIQ